jgi:GDP-L-fucose synthase
MKILVTGGHGFLGKHLCAELRLRGYNFVAPSFERYDLRRQIQVEELFEEHSPAVVIHLAANVGGIGANQKNPGAFLYDNAIMGLNLIEASRLSGVEKFIQIGTVCAYPKSPSVPFREEALWLGYPEETNAPYGIAKKILLTQLQAYREQYWLNGIYLIPTNLYGPGDNFNPETSHVIPGLIHRIDQAIKSNTHVKIWGTGNASREFLYVKDCARAIVMAMEKYNSPEPVNIGTGQETSIRAIAQLIANLMGYTKKLEFDLTKPDGQPRRCLNTERAKKFGFEATTDFFTGVQKTIEYYKANV